MKLFIILVISTMALQSQANSNSPCVEAANKSIEVLFWDHLEKESDCPNFDSPEGITNPAHLIQTNDSDLKFEAKGRYFCPAKDGYSTYSEVKLEISMSPDCQIRPKKNKIQEKVLNVEQPIDEKDGPPCSREVRLRCPKKFVDRCLVYPLADTHQCVPKNF